MAIDHYRSFHLIQLVITITTVLSQNRRAPAISDVISLNLMHVSQLDSGSVALPCSTGFGTSTRIFTGQVRRQQ